jgi:hypothetical protein
MCAQLKLSQLEVITQGSYGTYYFSNSICVSFAEGNEQGAIDISPTAGASASVRNKPA